MAEIVNLRQARKQKARAEKEARATENRASFGRTKAEKKLSRGQSRISRRAGSNSHKRDDDEKP